MANEEEYAPVRMFSLKNDSSYFKIESTEINYSHNTGVWIIWCHWWSFDSVWCPSWLVYGHCDSLHYCTVNRSYQQYSHVHALNADSVQYGRSIIIPIFRYIKCMLPSAAHTSFSLLLGRRNRTESVIYDVSNCRCYILCIYATGLHTTKRHCF